MDADLRHERFRETVVGLLSLERRLVQAIDRQDGCVREPTEAAALLRSLRERASGHIDALASYLAETSRDAVPVFAPDEGANTGTASPPAASGVLEAVFVQVNALAIGYATLHTMAMRLFELPLRELAPRHLRAHAEAARAITAVLPRVVAAELAAEGLPCMCRCPMCSIGICGCVAGALAVVDTAMREASLQGAGPPVALPDSLRVQLDWQKAAPGSGASPGYELQTPRPGSQLAALGVPGGARLLSVDGEAVNASPWVVQAAITAHGPTEEIRLRVAAADAPPRDLVVTRAVGAGA